MITPPNRPAALDALESIARETAIAESDLRENFAREIKRLETERARAYRRFNFLAALISADAGAPDRETSRDAQRRAAAEELDWDEIDESRAELLAAMEPLADAVHDERLLSAQEQAPAIEAEGVHLVSDGEQSVSPGVDRAAALLFALSAFEAQVEALRGKPFAELFDRYRPETPLVDF